MVFINVHVEREVSIGFCSKVNSRKKEIYIHIYIYIYIYTREIGGEDKHWEDEKCFLDRAHDSTRNEKRGTRVCVTILFSRSLVNSTHNKCADCAGLCLYCSFVRSTILLIIIIIIIITIIIVTLIIIIIIITIVIIVYNNNNNNNNNKSVINQRARYNRENKIRRNHD